MGKPLLTDEIIERANQGEDSYTEYSYQEADTEEFVLGDDEDLGEDLFEEHIFQSRRIENVKRQAIRAKLNMILILLLLVLVLVIYAVFNW